MTDAAALIARFVLQGGSLLLFGTLGFLLLADPASNPALTRLRRHLTSLSAATAILVCLAGLSVLAVQIETVPQQGVTDSELLGRLLFESRFGAVWLARWGLLVCAAILLATIVFLRDSLPSAPQLITTWALVGISLALAPLSSHSVTLEPAWPSLIAHSLHLLAAGSWLGGLLPMAFGVSMATRGRPEMLGPLSGGIERFSTLALPAMIIIVSSGAWIAFAQIETVPALLATPYGMGVIAKTIVLAAVLILAARLRRKLLPRLTSESTLPRKFVSHLALEWTMAMTIVLLAVWLASRVPARHDAILWWLPFRISIDATWTTDWVPAAALSSIAAGLAGLGLLVIGLWRRTSTPAATGFLIAICASATGMYALSVDAYPDTYRKPTVPYQTPSVAAGAALFRDHCVRCHGEDAHGGGPEASRLAMPPADLTEPHTALHTAGDIYWWLTHGKPPGIMPGFARVLSEDDRWDLINYLRTLAAGYQARIIDERVVPMQPWLGAIDFNYSDQHGVSASLKDHRGSNAVLLVFFSEGTSDSRMRELAANVEALRSAGAELIAIPVDGQSGRFATAPFTLAVEGDAETAIAYSLLRRTLADADPNDRAPTPKHMEFLIDRFGYVRARWLPGEAASWPDLVRQVGTVAAEPQIKPPPDDHVH